MRLEPLMMNLPGSPAESKYFGILRKRILHSHDTEGWDGLVRRVRDLAAEAETRWNAPDQSAFLAELTEALRFGCFLPNSPVLVNCGNTPRRLFACFAVDARRPLPAFLELVRDIHDGMGGVGYTLDPCTTHSEAKEFIRTVDDDTLLHQRGRPRPASTAVTVSIDSVSFDALLQLCGNVRTTILNIGIPDQFFSRVDAGDDTAIEKLNVLARTIHATGQPGIIFLDRLCVVARDPTAPVASNVCGEAPLAADESGLLGSVNLVQCLRRTATGRFTFDEERFTTLVHVAVRFLDDMIDLHAHTSPELMVNSMATRKIGVGVMGFAHALSLLGIRYGDSASIEIAERIACVLSAEAARESERLGRIRGPFPAWHSRLRLPTRRNATLVAIAATSTLALLAGTTGGIEPIFSHVMKHTVMGETVVVLDPIVAYVGAQRGIEPTQMLRRLTIGETLAEILGEHTARLFPCAHDIPGDEHIEIQSAFQRHIDGGISKTLNCGRETSVGDIANWLRLAHRRGCLGLTIYKESTSVNQPMMDAHEQLTR
jgi:ribonucleoside-diphosphate reductase alpha chain